MGLSQDVNAKLTAVIKQATAIDADYVAALMDGGPGRAITEEFNANNPEAKIIPGHLAGAQMARYNNAGAWNIINDLRAHIHDLCAA